MSRSSCILPAHMSFMCMLSHPSPARGPLRGACSQRLHVDPHQRGRWLIRSVRRCDKIMDVVNRKRQRIPFGNGGAILRSLCLVSRALRTTEDIQKACRITRCYYVLFLAVFVELVTNSVDTLLDWYKLDSFTSSPMSDDPSAENPPAGSKSLSLDEAFSGATGVQ